MPIPTIAAVGTGLARAGVWAGTAAFGYYGVKTSISPKQHEAIPYR
jgi:hypothetical protein